METDPRITEFWEAHRDQLPAGAELDDVFRFGDSPEMADEMAGELVGLVMVGTKRAAAGLLWEYEAEDEALSEVGSFSVVTNSVGRPLCIIETTDVRVLPFNQVDAQFAFDEGEGDRSLESWRSVHWDLFGRMCARIGREPSDEMPVVCERFRLVWPALQDGPDAG